MESAFDEVRLRKLLWSFHPLQQLAFGIACTERIASNYYELVKETDWGDPAPLRRALDAAWRACMGITEDAADIRILIADCERTIPDSESLDSFYTTAAQDAVFAACSLLDFLLVQNESHIINAARYSTDSIDLFVQESENIDPQDRDLEIKVLRHPLMQQELLRQKRDLVSIKTLCGGDEDSVLRFKNERKSELAFKLSDQPQQP